MQHDSSQMLVKLIYRLGKTSVAHLKRWKATGNFLNLNERAIQATSIFIGEFDPGSGRTLAACLTHASRTGRLEACFYEPSGKRVSNA